MTIQLTRAFAVLLISALGGCAIFSSNPSYRTPGTVIDDNLLSNVVERQIRKSNPDYKGSHIVVASYNGVVLIAGQVATEALKANATTVADRLRKVRRVHNELTIGGPISVLARGNDAMLTAKVKTKLLTGKETDATKVKVLTENGVVYLMGLLTREHADKVVNVARTAYGVQKIIKVFEYLESQPVAQVTASQ